MVVTETLAQRPEFQAWVRQLHINGLYQTAWSVENGTIPKGFVSYLLCYIREQKKINQLLDV